MNVHIERASDVDGPSILQLLRETGLPLDGLSEHLDTAFVARDGGALVGCAALEVYADGVLLRSVAVAAAARGQGLGQRLTDAAITLAKSLGVPAVYLLTTTAESYFAKFGFAAMEREQVPPSVQQSIEFRAACPASAVVMMKSLNDIPEEERHARDRNGRDCRRCECHHACERAGQPRDEVPDDNDIQS